jgi:hypothetical protein
MHTEVLVVMRVVVVYGGQLVYAVSLDGGTNRRIGAQRSATFFSVTFFPQCTFRNVLSATFFPQRSFRNVLSATFFMQEDSVLIVKL